MQVRNWHVVPAIVVTAVLAVAVSVLVNRGPAEALVLTALVAVMTVLYRPGAVQAPAGVSLPTPGKKRRASWPSPALVGGRYHGEA